MLSLSCLYPVRSRWTRRAVRLTAAAFVVWQEHVRQEGASHGLLPPAARDGAASRISAGRGGAFPGGQQGGWPQSQTKGLPPGGHSGYCGEPAVVGAGAGAGGLIALDLTPASSPPQPFVVPVVAA